MGHFTADVTVLKFLNKSHQNHEVVVGSIHNQGTTGVTSLQLQRRFDQDSMQTWEVTQITYKSIEKRGNLDVIFDVWVLFPENSMVWFVSLIFHEIQWIKYCRKGWISPAFPGFTVLYVWLYVMVFNMSGDIHDLVCRPLIVCLFVCCFFSLEFLGSESVRPAAVTVKVHHRVYRPCNCILCSRAGPRGHMGLCHLWSKQALQRHLLSTSLTLEGGIRALNQ